MSAKGRNLTPLEQAILRTVIYADIFSFPLNRRELHHYLIAERPYHLCEIEHVLETSEFLKNELEYDEIEAIFKKFNVKPKYRPDILPA